jgi:hypothetical protein
MPVNSLIKYGWLSTGSEMSDHNILDISPGDIIRLKKKHPCGSFQWLVLKTGVDFRLRCTGCGHEMLMERQIVERKLKGEVTRGTLPE